MVRSQRAAQSFPGGCVAIDYFGDADLVSLADGHTFKVLSGRRDLGRPRSVFELARSALRCDWQALLYSGGLENRPDLLRRLERRGEVLGNASDALKRVRAPTLLFPFLQRAGIPHPQTLAHVQRAPHGSRWMWKPFRSGGGIGVRRARPGESRPPGFYLQRYLQGPSGSAAFVADGHRSVLLGVSEQLVGARRLGGEGFRYCGSVAGPADQLLSRRALEHLAKAASAVAFRFRLRGLGGLDFVLSQGIPHILEVNPRYTASMELLEELSGANFIDIHLDALASGRLPAGLLPVSGFLGKGILYASGPVNWSSSCAAPFRDVRDRPQEGETIDPSHPICTLVLEGASPGECRQALLGAGSRLRRALSSKTRPSSSRTQTRASAFDATRVTERASMLR